MTTAKKPDFDIAVIGGGINGAAVARDAVGRGHSVWLAEAEDYAIGTSSRSSKLIHGGIRYLEQFEFRLVYESLHEREALMNMAPHLVFPMRFLVPIRKDQKRAGWIVRLGLFLYDVLSGRKVLGRTGKLSKGDASAIPHLDHEGLKSVLHYPDCWTDDARLTLETLLDARERGADIHNRRRVTSIEPAQEGYRLTTAEGKSLTARFVVNAGGPWALSILDKAKSINTNRRLRLVRGSHVIVRMPAPADPNAYLLQNPDGRVVFVIPWLDNRFRIIGTTDEPHEGSADNPTCSDKERDYILATHNRYFDNDLTAQDVLDTYAGVRPLVDDGSDNPSKVTREYELEVHQSGDGALLTIFGGKLTTHRKLGELVMKRLEQLGLPARPAWTDQEVLHGGALDRPALAALADAGPAALSKAICHRWAFTYGSVTSDLYNTVEDDPALAQQLVPNVPLAELWHAVQVEDCRNGDDFLHRRTKLYMALTPSDIDTVNQWFAENC
ncbi:MAG: glycerol-3-phosphate dehydrogenase [Alphaproteobacteria bacterium]